MLLRHKRNLNSVPKHFNLQISGSWMRETDKTGKRQKEREGERRRERERRERREGGGGEEE